MQHNDTYVSAYSFYSLASSLYFTNLCFQTLLGTFSLPKAVEALMTQK